MCSLVRPSRSQAAALADRQPRDRISRRLGRRALPEHHQHRHGAGGVHAGCRRHGGNAATQTLTVIVRGIALGELTWTNSRKALVKETLVGLGNGLACGLVGALVVFLVKGDGWLGTILAMAMVINMFVAATAGTLIPLALRALKVDPALASSVFITTLTDVFGFLSFLGLGTLFIKYLHVAG